MNKPEYDRLHREKYKELRAKILLEYGTRCFNCNGTDDLQFHHISYEEDEKKIGPNSSTTELVRFMERIEKEPTKYRLVCAKCHRAITGITLYMKRRKLFPKLDDVFEATIGTIAFEKLLKDLGLVRLKK